MAKIVAYLYFGGNCREAMTFYQQCLGGELQMQTIGESPMGEQASAAEKEKILHAHLEKSALELLASDMFGSEEAVRGNTTSLCLDCSSEEEVRTLFANLSAGGKVGHPLQEEFWGAIFGELTDKFGVNWMFNYNKP